MRGRRLYRLTPLLLALLLPNPACVKNPVTGGRQLALISESQEIEIGRASHPEILAQFGAVENKVLQDYIGRIGLELSGISHRPELPWHFTVLDSPVVNAFAVPGGYIYLTRGILAYMNSEAELASVLGHEIGHVTARHSVTQISQQQLLGLGIGLGSVFSPTFRQLSDFAQMGLGILMLKYSRDHERQSDQLGIQYMGLAGYDPSQMSGFFRVFEALEEDSGKAIPSWLSSHPAPPDRIRATAVEADHFKQQGTMRQYKVSREEFLARIDGIIFGDNPREGFVDQGRFVHPELRFALNFPDGWNVQNTRSEVIFAEPAGDAAIQLALVPPTAGQTPEAVGENLGRREGIQLIEGARTQIGGCPAFLGSYRAQSSQGSAAILAAFVAYGTNLYQIAGLTAESSYTRFADLFDSSLRSFRELSEKRLLSVQPDRLQLYRTRENETLRKISRSRPQTRIRLEDLAILNRIDPDQILQPGTVIKLVLEGR